MLVFFLFNFCPYCKQTQLWLLNMWLLSLSGATLYVEERNNGVFLDAKVKNPLTAKLQDKINI